MLRAFHSLRASCELRVRMAWSRGLERARWFSHFCNQENATCLIPLKVMKALWTHVRLGAKSLKGWRLPLIRARFCTSCGDFLLFTELQLCRYLSGWFGWQGVDCAITDSSRGLFCPLFPEHERGQEEMGIIGIADRRPVRE